MWSLLRSLVIKISLTTQFYRIDHLKEWVDKVEGTGSIRGAGPGNKGGDNEMWEGCIGDGKRESIRTESEK